MYCYGRGSKSRRVEILNYAFDYMVFAIGFLIIMNSDEDCFVNFLKSVTMMGARVSYHVEFAYLHMMWHFFFQNLPHFMILTTLVSQILGIRIFCGLSIIYSQSLYFGNSFTW